MATEIEGDRERERDRSTASATKKYEIKSEVWSELLCVRVNEISMQMG